MAKKTDKKVTKTDAVLEALAEGVDSPTDGVAHVLARHGIEMTNAQFSTIKSKAKSGASGEVKVSGRSGAVRVAAPSRLGRMARFAFFHLIRCVGCGWRFWRLTTVPPPYPLPLT